MKKIKKEKCVEEQEEGKGEGRGGGQREREAGEVRGRTLVTLAKVHWR